MEIPLIYAIDGEHIETVNALIDAGVNIDAKSDYDGTAFMKAAEKRNFDILEAAGANPEGSEALLEI